MDLDRPTTSGRLPEPTEESPPTLAPAAAAGEGDAPPERLSEDLAEALHKARTHLAKARVWLAEAVALADRRDETKGRVAALLCADGYAQQAAARVAGEP